LTNKTLTSPSITTPTGIVKGDVGLGNVDNTSDATKNAATVVLTNKDIDGGTASNTSRITLPKAAKTALDALTRKQGTVVYDTTSNRPYYDDGTNLQLIGSGGGGVNFVTNPDAEAGTAGWTVDSFAAASRPAGSLTAVTTGITFATSSSSPLAGTNSFTFAKDAANRQGRVVYTGLTFTPAYFARVMNISVDMIVASGTFVAGTSTTDSDLIWYIQNVTDGTFIEPSNFKILSNSSTNSFQFNGTFQTAASATSYRLLGYVASTSAAAYTLRFDNVTVTPSTYAYGTPITDWQAYTPTFTGFGTPSAIQFQWRRVGDSAEIQGKFTSGTSTGTEARITLPSVTSADTSKIPSIMHVGNMAYSASQASEYHVLIEPSVGYLTFGSQSASVASLTKLSGSSLVSSGQSMSFNATVPISGWSSSVQTSDQTDTRVVSMSASNSVATQAITGSATNINFLTVNKDSHSAWSGSVYTVPVAGDYTITASVYSTSAAINLYLFINGTVNKAISYNPANVVASGSVLIPNLRVGDTISVRGATSVTVAADSTQTITISRVAGPNQIAASESVYARYTSSNAQIVNNSTTQVIEFATRDRDTHNAVSGTGTGWRFTAPISGFYEVNATTITGGAGASGYINLSILKNGTLFLEGVNIVSINASSQGSSVSGALYLLAGEYISVALANLATGAQRTTSAVAAQNHVTIKRVGN
jgi:hypothetical protein